MWWGGEKRAKALKANKAYNYLQFKNTGLRYDQAGLSVFFQSFGMSVVWFISAVDLCCMIKV